MAFSDVRGRRNALSVCRSGVSLQQNVDHTQSYEHTYIRACWIKVSTCFVILLVSETTGFGIKGIGSQSSGSFLCARRHVKSISSTYQNIWAHRCDVCPAFHSQTSWIAFCSFCMLHHTCGHLGHFFLEFHPVTPWTLRKSSVAVDTIMLAGWAVALVLF